jgi:hypothetical protein
LAACVGDDPEQVMVVQAIFGSSSMSEIPKGVPMTHSSF